MSFLDKVVIVTGASSGIGADVSIHFAKLGAKVVITGRNEINLEETVSKCGDGALKIVADLNDESDRVRIIEETLTKFGKIDVLVNNAGIGDTGGILTTPMEQFDLVISTNIRSIFTLRNSRCLI